jgi:hypothetical protein
MPDSVPATALLFLARSLPQGIERTSPAPEPAGFCVAHKASARRQLRSLRLAAAHAAAVSSQMAGYEEGLKSRRRGSKRHAECSEGARRW